MGGLARPTPQGHGPKGYLTSTSPSIILTEKVKWLALTGSMNLFTNPSDLLVI